MYFHTEPTLTQSYIYETLTLLSVVFENEYARQGIAISVKLNTEPSCGESLLFLKTSDEFNIYVVLDKC